MNREELRSLLDRLRAPVLPPALKSATLRYRFHLTDDDRQWDLVLRDGRLLLEDTKGPVDCKMECSAGEFAGLLTGRNNLLTAFMRGNLIIQGALRSAKLLYTFLRFSEMAEVKA